MVGLVGKEPGLHPDFAPPVTVSDNHLTSSHSTAPVWHQHVLDAAIACVSRSQFVPVANNLPADVSVSFLAGGHEGHKKGIHPVIRTGEFGC